MADQKVVAKREQGRSGDMSKYVIERDIPNAGKLSPQVRIRVASRS